MVHCYPSLRKLIQMWHLGHTGSSVCSRWKRGVQRQKGSQHGETSVCGGWNKVLELTGAHFSGVWIFLIFRYFSNIAKKYSFSPPQILKPSKDRFLPFASKKVIISHSAFPVIWMKFDLGCLRNWHHCKIAFHFQIGKRTTFSYKDTVFHGVTGSPQE